MDKQIMELQLVAARAVEVDGAAAGAAAAGMIAAMLIAVVLSLAIFVAIMFFFSKTLGGAIAACAPENRKLDPSSTKLLMIPIFHIVWLFMNLSKVRDTLAAEFAARGTPAPEGDFGYNIGMGWAICSVAGIVPLLNMIAGPAGLVCFILYWVKANDYKNRLASPGAPVTA